MAEVGAEADGGKRRSRWDPRHLAKKIFPGSREPSSTPDLRAVVEDLPQQSSLAAQKPPTPSRRRSGSTGSLTAGEPPGGLFAVPPPGGFDEGAPRSSRSNRSLNSGNGIRRSTSATALEGGILLPALSPGREVLTPARTPETPQRRSTPTHRVPAGSPGASSEDPLNHSGELRMPSPLRPTRPPSAGSQRRPLPRGGSSQRLVLSKDDTPQRSPPDTPKRVPTAQRPPTSDRISMASSMPSFPTADALRDPQRSPLAERPPTSLRPLGSPLRPLTSQDKATASTQRPLTTSEKLASRSPFGEVASPSSTSSSRVPAGQERPPSSGHRPPTSERPSSALRRRSSRQQIICQDVQDPSRKEQVSTPSSSAKLPSREKQRAQEVQELAEFDRTLEEIQRESHPAEARRDPPVEAPQTVESQLDQTFKELEELQPPPPAIPTVVSPARQERPQEVQQVVPRATQEEPELRTDVRQGDSEVDEDADAQLDLPPAPPVPPKTPLITKHNQPPPPPLPPPPPAASEPSIVSVSGTPTGSRPTSQQSRRMVPRGAKAELMATLGSTGNSLMSVTAPSPSADVPGFARSNSGKSSASTKPAPASSEPQKTPQATPRAHVQPPPLPSWSPELVAAVPTEKKERLTLREPLPMELLEEEADFAEGGAASEGGREVDLGDEMSLLPPLPKPDPKWHESAPAATPTSTSAPVAPAVGDNVPSGETGGGLETKQPPLPQQQTTATPTMMTTSSKVLGFGPSSMAPVVRPDRAYRAAARRLPAHPEHAVSCNGVADLNGLADLAAGRTSSTSPPVSKSGRKEGSVALSSRPTTAGDGGESTVSGLSRQQSNRSNIWREEWNPGSAPPVPPPPILSAERVAIAALAALPRFNAVQQQVPPPLPNQEPAAASPSAGAVLTTPQADAADGGLDAALKKMSEQAAGGYATRPPPLAPGRWARVNGASAAQMVEVGGAALRVAGSTPTAAGARQPAPPPVPGSSGAEATTTTTPAGADAVSGSRRTTPRPGEFSDLALSFAVIESVA